VRILTLALGLILISVILMVFVGIGVGIGFIGIVLLTNFVIIIRDVMSEQPEIVATDG
jgi:hypothetical protein